MKNKKTKISLGVLASLFLIFIWLLPNIVKNVIEKNGKEWTGRKITVEDIDINLFTGTVKLFNFDFYELDEIASFISFDTLVLNTKPYHYVTSKITVQQFYLSNLVANVIKENDTVFNFDSLVDFYDTPADTLVVETEVDSTESLKFSLSNIELVNAEISFEDKIIEDIFIFNELGFLIPNIEWNQKDVSSADLGFNFKDGGRFYSKTNFDPILGDFSVVAGLEDLNLFPYTDYLKDFVLLDSVSGLFSTNLNLRGNSNDLESIAIDGFVQVDNFQLTDTLQKPILKANKIDCVLGSFEPLKNSFIIDTLSIVEPFIAFDLYHDSNNFETFFKLNETIEVEEEEPTQAEVESQLVENDSVLPLYYRLNSFLISNGRLKFTDATTSKPFQYDLTNIGMHIDSIDSETTWADTHMDMLLNKRGVMKVDLSFNPSDPMELELKYIISGFKLNDLNIYSLDYMGVPVLEGDMYYKTYTKIHNGEIESSNKLIVHDATLGDKRGGLYNLPLKFALFLLKDKDGVVNLDVPVSGDLNDPSVSVNKIVWYTFKNLLVKTVASPAKFLAGLVGGNPKELEMLEYSYLDTALTSMHIKQLGKLQDLEKKKEGLKIEMLYLNDVEIEKKHIAVQQVGEHYNKEFNSDYVENEMEFKLYLLSKTQNDSTQATIEKMLDSAFVQNACLYLSNPIIVDSISKTFESKRIESIRNELLNSMTKNEIKVKKAEINDAENIGSKPIFKIIYSIEE